MNSLKKTVMTIFLLLSVALSNAQIKNTTSQKQINTVSDNYFSLKEALVATDASLATTKAKELLSAINAVKMEDLEMEQHMVWMKIKDNLSSDVKKITEAKNIKIQRDLFKNVSLNIYALQKVSKSDTPTYYQYCPMAKANWLSKESTIKNPYYGSQMMSCGKTIEIINK